VSDLAAPEPPAGHRHLWLAMAILTALVVSTMLVAARRDRLARLWRINRTTGGWCGSNWTPPARRSSAAGSRAARPPVADQRRGSRPLARLGGNVAPAA
jgi:hypothetical protein